MHLTQLAFCLMSWPFCHQHSACQRRYITPIWIHNTWQADEILRMMQSTEIYNMIKNSKTNRKKNTKRALKVHYVVVGKKFESEDKDHHWLIFFMPKQTNYLCFHVWINCQNKLTFKDNTVTCCFTLFTCGGPCHLSSFQECSGVLISLLELLVF